MVLDARTAKLSLSAAAIRQIADRRRGVGCDQLILIEPDEAGADGFMRILNADGSESGACGNATRCVAALLAEESGERRVTIRTISGLLSAEILGPGLVEVDMGMPLPEWGDIPSPAPRTRCICSWRSARSPTPPPAPWATRTPPSSSMI